MRAGDVGARDLVVEAAPGTKAEEIAIVVVERDDDGEGIAERGKPVRLSRRRNFVDDIPVLGIDRIELVRIPGADP